MQDFETEEQQVEAVKKWLKENASSLLIGLAIGGFSLGGWNFYQQTQYQHGVEASDMYVALVAQVEASSASELDLASADKLQAGYADTPYAALSAMAVAKHEIAAGNNEQAASRLQWVVDNAIDEEMVYVAQLRLARLMIAQEEYDRAEALLSVKHSAAFDALYEELKGDMFVAKGELEQARIAYDKAIASGNSSHWLQLKRQDLGSSEFNQSESIEPAA